MEDDRNHGCERGSVIRVRCERTLLLLGTWYSAMHCGMLLGVKVQEILASKESEFYQAENKDLEKNRQQDPQGSREERGHSNRAINHGLLEEEDFLSDTEWPLRSN